MRQKPWKEANFSFDKRFMTTFVGVRHRSYLLGFGRTFVFALFHFCLRFGEFLFQFDQSSFTFRPRDNRVSIVERLFRLK
uniref:Transmembrane protein n=1 Tax=Globodera rostochiensis TaxID=31243 RepID=A0A914H2G9_GLORO